MLLAAAKEVLQSLSAVHRRKAEAYRHLLASSEPTGFWDVVVITAADAEQQWFYEQQLKEKIHAKEIPTWLKYHVVPDPPGPKIGCGGSTMLVLEYLDKIYGSQLDQWKVLAFHAGGYSKRLPNHSATGKIFAALPYSLTEGGPACTMLEMKLILFIDFPQRMMPGVFISCADDIEFFESEGSAQSDASWILTLQVQGCSFESPGFMAMAHPAPAAIGRTHGVFVLENPSSVLNAAGDATAHPCKQFLHKSSLMAMRDAGAFLPPLPFSPEGDHVFVDSNFFFDRRIAKMLLEFHAKVSPLTCEIDAYGDFLQPLGPHASAEYLGTTFNVIKVTDSLQNVRTGLFDLLRGQELHALPFVPSLFLHIGTCEEYIEHFCCNLHQLGFPRNVLTAITDAATLDENSCVLHSIIGRNVSAGENSVVEFSHIENAHIGKECIISDVCITGDERGITDGIFMQTLPIRNDKPYEYFESASQLYLTAVFGTRDDFKKAMAKEQIACLTLRGVSIIRIITLLGLSVEDVWPHTSEPSLWNARLFSVATTAVASADHALAFLGMVNIAADGRAETCAKESKGGDTRLSWEDALQLKNLPAISERRSELRFRIERK